MYGPFVSTANFIVLNLTMLAVHPNTSEQMPTNVTSDPVARVLGVLLLNNAFKFRK